MKKKLSNPRSYFKRAIARLLVLLIVVGTIVPSAAGTSYAALGTDFFDGLTPYGGTVNERTGDGYRIAGSGDIPAMSAIDKTDFVFETDVTFNTTTGSAIGLVFASEGGSNPTQNPGSWVCNIERSGLAKLFSWGGKSSANNQQVALPSAIQNLETYNLKMVVKDNTLQYYINDYIIFSQKVLNDYNGGYLGIMAFNADVTFTGAEVYEPETVSDLPITGFTGEIFDTGDGFLVKSKNGDNAATSDISARAFEFEADVELLDGGYGAQSAALVIGKTDTNVWPGIGANVDKGGGGVAKLFKEPGSVYSLQYSLSAGQKAGNKFHIKVIADDDGNIEYWLDGSRILEKNDPDYIGGKLGLLTFKAAAIFNNIKFTNNDTATGTFNTNLSNLTGLKGTWTNAASGLLSQGTGDNFAISQTAGTDFVYSADIKYCNGLSGAGSLVFRSTADSKSCYVANVDTTARTARIFKFTNENYMGDVLSGTIPASKDEYNLRVEAIGNTLKLYVDDVLIGVGTDDSYSSGYFGLLTFNTTINYQNVIQTPGDKDNLPKLTGLVVDGASIEFNSNSTAYKAFVDNGVAYVTVAPSTSTGNTMKINAVRADATVILPEQAIVSGETSPEIPLEVGDNTINIKVKDSSGVEVVTSVKITRNFNPATAYTDTYRPQLHFTPHRNFINDPNGLVFDPSNNTWHMFFQYNPTGITIGNQVWGHTQSTDLVHWVEQPVAIPQGDGLGAIFSGSAVVDEDNTSGFFTNNAEGQSRLVAIFTHDKPNDTVYGVEKQSIAYSKDHGLTWTLYPGNPVIPNTGEIYGRDFRDPKVFRHDGKWLMVVAGGRGRIFSSDNLINWSLESEICKKDGTTPMYSECPDLYPLKVDGTGDTKWIYTASGRWYVIGDLIKNASGKYEFRPETDQIPYNSDTGYATQSYYNDGSGQDRRIAVSWIQEYSGGSTSFNGYNPVSPDKLWNGMQTLPQVQELKTINGEIRLTSYPVEEINQQRSSQPVFTLSNKEVSQDTANVLAGVAGKKYDIETTINMGDAAEVGFNLMTGSGKHVAVKYNDIQNKLILDRSTVAYTGGTTNGATVQSSAMSKDKDGNIKLRIIVDVSVIEVFGNDGEAAANHAFFTDAGNAGLEFYAVGGTAVISDLKIYDMKSIYRNDIGGTTPDKLFLGASQDKNTIEVGQTFTVNAAVMPMTATDRTVTWAVTDESVFRIEAQDGNAITLTALKEGSADIKAITNMGAIAQTLTAKVIKVNFVTNMTGWKSTVGVWKKDDNGYSSLNKSSGDSFAMSDNSSSAFIYEAQISNFDGQAAGLVFGVANPSAPSSKPWYCVNIDKGAGIAKMFYNTGTNQVWDVSKPLTAGQKAATAFKFKVVVANDGKMQYYLDDVLVGEKTGNNFTAGGIGLITFKANATFNNVTLNTPVAANVSVTGTAKAGETLTGNYSFSATDSATEGTSVYRWLAGDSLTGTFAAIPGAVEKTYIPTAEMIGKYLKFEVTPIDSNGWSGTPARSAATSAVTDESGKAVTSITVSSVNGLASISTKSGTLQMVAVVAPEDAADKSVTWSVTNGTGSAAISAAGLLTAVSDGTVTVKATANDGSKVVSNLYTVTITGQSDSNGGGNNGGNSGGNGGNSGGTSTGSTTPASEKPAVTSSEIELKPAVSGSTAKAAVNSTDIQKAFDAAKTGADGIKTVTLNVAKVAGANSYEVEIPKSVLSSGSAGNMLKIITPAGTINAPGNLFKPEELSGNNVQLSIGLADKAAINETVKNNIGDRPVIEVKASAGGKTIDWSNPEASVNISLDYKPTQQELKKPEHITVWYIDENGAAVAVPSGRYDPATGKVTFTNTKSGKYAVVYVEKAYSDLAGYSWAKDKIEVMAAKGIINGTTGTTFSPAQNIKRADFIVLLVKALGLDARGDSNFDDVKEGIYYYDAVATAKALGITEGVGDNKFNPNGQISRQDMMVLAAKALKVAGIQMKAGTASDIAGFKDASKVSAYASDAAATLINAGIIKGSGNEINPTSKLTRAEAAVVIYNIYNIYNK